MPRPDPIPELKRRAAAELLRAVEGCTLGEAAGFIGIDRWRVADLRAGRLERFSLETLIRFLARVNAELSLEIRHSPLFVPRSNRSV
jgi:predicted XRE-type DNA-binding protein